MADIVLSPVISDIKPVPTNGTEYLHAIVPANQKYKVAILNEQGAVIASFPDINATAKTEKNCIIQVRVRVNDSFDKDNFGTKE